MKLAPALGQDRAVQTTLLRDPLALPVLIVAGHWAGGLADAVAAVVDDLDVVLRPDEILVGEVDQRLGALRQRAEDIQPLAE